MHHLELRRNICLVVWICVSEIYWADFAVHKVGEFAQRPKKVFTFSNFPKLQIELIHTGNYGGAEVMSSSRVSSIAYAQLLHVCKWVCKCTCVCVPVVLWQTAILIPAYNPTLPRVCPRMRSRSSVTLTRTERLLKTNKRAVFLHKTLYRWRSDCTFKADVDWCWQETAVQL